MSEPISLRLLAILLGAWVAGFFLLLPEEHKAESRRMRLTGFLLTGLALLLLALFFGTRPDSWPKPQLGFWNVDFPHWWPDSELQETVSGIVFGLFSVGSLFSATAAVCGHTSRQSVAWFALMLVFVSGLCLVHGVFTAAIACLLLAGVTGGMVWRTRSIPNPVDTMQTVTAVGKPVEHSPSETSHSILACVTGFILGVSLLGTVTYALNHEAGAAGISTGRTMLTVRFPTPGNHQNQNASSSENNGADGAWVLLVALTGLVVTTVGGILLITKRQTVNHTDHSQEFTGGQHRDG
jgi:hypothetical protein